MLFMITDRRRARKCSLAPASGSGAELLGGEKGDPEDDHEHDDFLHERRR
jgi:hypothetical protein